MVVVLVSLLWLPAAADKAGVVEETLLLVVKLLCGSPAPIAVTFWASHLISMYCAVLCYLAPLTWGLQLVTSMSPHFSCTTYSHEGEATACKVSVIHGLLPPLSYLALQTHLGAGVLRLLAGGVGDLFVVSADHLGGVQHSLVLLLLEHLPLHLLALVLARPLLLSFCVDFPQGVAELLGDSLGHLPDLGVADLLLLGFARLGDERLLDLVNLD